MTDNNKTEDKKKNPVDRFVDYLREKGMEEEQISFMTGRLAKRATSRVLKDTLELFDESEKDRIEEMDNDEFMDELKKRLEKEKKMSYEEYQLAVYKELVDEILDKEN